jgi:hypothetical protein
MGKAKVVEQSVAAYSVNAAEIRRKSIVWRANQANLTEAEERLSCDQHEGRVETHLRVWEVS